MEVFLSVLYFFVMFCDQVNCRPSIKILERLPGYLSTAWNTIVSILQQPVNSRDENNYESDNERGTFVPQWIPEKKTTNIYADIPQQQRTVFSVDSLLIPTLKPKKLPGVEDPKTTQGNVVTTTSLLTYDQFMEHNGYKKPHIKNTNTTEQNEYKINIIKNKGENFTIINIILPGKHSNISRSITNSNGNDEHFSAIRRTNQELKNERENSTIEKITFGKGSNKLSSITYGNNELFYAIRRTIQGLQNKWKNYETVKTKFEKTFDKSRSTANANNSAIRRIQVLKNKEENSTTTEITFEKKPNNLRSVANGSGNNRLFSETRHTIQVLENKVEHSTEIENLLEKKPYKSRSIPNDYNNDKNELSSVAERIIQVIENKRQNSIKTEIILEKKPNESKSAIINLSKYW